MNDTFIPNSNYCTKNWYIVDATNKPVGRIATVISTLLQGKHKPDYHPSINMGDSIIVINAEKVTANPSKLKYHVYSPGRPGSSLKKVVNRVPKKIIEDTVRNMLPKSLRSAISKQLYIYDSSKHPHSAQKPILFKR